MLHHLNEEVRYDDDSLKNNASVIIVLVQDLDRRTVSMLALYIELAVSLMSVSSCWLSVFPD